MTDRYTIPDDLREWVNRTLPTVTDWDEVERIAVAVYAVTPTWAAADVRASYQDQARALIAGLDEIAEDLVDVARTPSEWVALKIKCDQCIGTGKTRHPYCGPREPCCLCGGDGFTALGRAIVKRARKMKEQRPWIT